MQDEDGLYFDSATIPSRVKQAVYICALELLRVDFISEDYLNNFAFFSAGNIQFKQFTQQSAIPALISQVVQ